MMRRILVVAVFICASTSSSQLLAQALKADDVIAKAHQARGGEDKLRAMQSVKMTGKILVQGALEGKCTVYLKRPAMLRVESTVQGFTIIQGFDGPNGNAWVQNPLVGALEPRKANPNETKQLECQALMFDDDLLDHKNKGNKLQLLGKRSVEILTKESIEGFTAFELKVTRKTGDVVTIDIDADTFLPLKQSVKVPTSNGAAEMITLQRSFRSVGGVIVPYAIEQTIGGKPYIKMAFEKIELNPQLDDALFTLPAGK
jgi:outer membrane lipoprotein-sorting protein